MGTSKLFIGGLNLALRFHSTIRCETSIHLMVDEWVDMFQNKIVGVLYMLNSVQPLI